MSIREVTHILGTNRVSGILLDVYKRQVLGGEKGFVLQSLLVFKSGLRTGDYHGEMNSDNFIKWIKTQLIPNLP